MPHANGTVGWEPEPTTRGTASLVFNCISTTLICTWSTLHLHVPRRQDVSDAHLFMRKLSYLVVALLAPEFIAVCAHKDWQSARHLTEAMHTRAGLHDWSAPLSLFIVMRGVHIQYPSGKTLPLQARGAYKFYQNNWIDPAAISLKAIKDKSKANGFTKAIASVQICWFLSQLVGRAVVDLPITPLELFTLAYIVCAFAAYFFWWNKPFDVHVPLVIPTQPSFPRDHEWHYRKRTYWRKMQFRYFGDGLSEDFGAPLTVAFFMIVCALFGACHLAGWNAYFPTPEERLLWRIGSVCCVGLPSLLALLSVMPAVTRILGSDVVGVGITSTYAIVRVALLFEAFYSLRSTPADVYKAVPWAQYLPHI